MVESLIQTSGMTLNAPDLEYAKYNYIIDELTSSLTVSVFDQFIDFTA